MNSLYQISSPMPRSTWIYEALTIFAGSLFIALLAQIAIPLPFTPIPLTLQSLAVLMVGGILGSKKGFLAIMAYFAEGAVGLPVFAKASSGLFLMGPRCGYMVGFALAAFLVGYLLERGWKHHYVLSSLACVSGSLLILVLGAFGLSFFIGRENAFRLGFLPFIFMDLLKSFLAAVLLSSGSKILKAIR